MFLIRRFYAFCSFLRNFKGKCLSKPGNPEFWSQVKKVGRDLSLISKGDAKKQGGLSSIADDEAEEVRSFCEALNQRLLIPFPVYFLNNCKRIVTVHYTINYFSMMCLSSEITNGL